ncbi:hypothetical protein [Azospira restricta]|uniref:Uncharacterized protein n=1 Tax=Azospira restricta TaxID=404405 RepID=A0A974Y568_9RHOO|nr:hypothetical protein [Azospira restricta]QRJ65104.1 hypothetical protein IWH25_07120 [Azospira restricta]
MKRAKRLKPRNPVAVQPLLQKGGAHERKDEKKSARARAKARLQRRLREEFTS